MVVPRCACAGDRRGATTAGAGRLGAARCRVLRRLCDALPGRARFGVDYNPGAAARAAAKSGARVAAADVNALPFAGGAFGVAISIDVLCHRLVTPERALAELHRVLAPGGTLVLNLPAFEWLKSAHDAHVHTARRFTAGQSRRLVGDAGFVDVEARYWNSLLLPIMVLQRKVLAAGSDAASDVAPYPPWLDRTLHRVTALERRLGSLGLRYPAGGSVLVVATRP